MIDLHTHTVFSDGELIPAELVRRAEYKGYRGIGLTDHGDMSNIDFIIPRIVEVAFELNKVLNIKVIPGIEITHVPPILISDVAKKARELGSKLIIVHGETIVEPVAKGTNLAALNSDIDILAHPGQISMEEVLLAKKNGISLEITGRGGHSLTNGRVAKLAKESGTNLVINSDSHHPNDLLEKSFAMSVVKGAGLNSEDFKVMQKNAEKFF
ncbi:MAG: histidinol phosphate phosphatase domain-containing protein [Desulfobacterales bacterium]|nr:histidinol phosphate phosphatase domain-containing protein [Desulfobacterales bacterium]MCP4163769.1 histidinol phosphate phosphatase domain-containing protein [Deltaproteobacteria bacterium]